MPLLPPEPFVFPETLFTAPQAPAVGDREVWWVLHTRPRAEKALARQLLSSATPFFLPLYKKQWLSGGRKHSSHPPLFPGYVFLHGDDQARSRALETNLVAHCLPVFEQGRLHVDLTGIHQLMTCDLPLTPESQLIAGTRVEVVDGPFMGLVGKVVRRGAQHRFVIEVQMINQGVSVDMDRWMFRPLPEREGGAKRLQASQLQG